MINKSKLLNWCTFVVCTIGIFVGRDSAAQTISNENPISFGVIVVGGAGDVTIPSNADTRSATGAVALAGSGLVARGYADITFTPGAQIQINDPGPIVMTGPNAPTIDLTVQGGNIQTMPLSGVLRVYFGGTITFTTFGATGALTVLVPVDVQP